MAQLIRQGEFHVQVHVVESEAEGVSRFGANVVGAIKYIVSHQLGPVLPHVVGGKIYAPGYDSEHLRPESEVRNYILSVYHYIMFLTPEFLSNPTSEEVYRAAVGGSIF